MRYLRRPKLIIEPHCWGPEPNVRLLGFIVRNVGHNIARGVYGEAEFKLLQVNAMGIIEYAGMIR